MQKRSCLSAQITGCRIFLDVHRRDIIPVMIVLAIGFVAVIRLAHILLQNAYVVSFVMLVVAALLITTGLVCVAMWREKKLRQKRIRTRSRS